MSKWEKFNDWFWSVGITIIIISIIGGIVLFGYHCHKEFEAQYDYKVKIMDSRDGTTYYVKKEDIEIIDEEEVIVKKVYDKERIVISYGEYGNLLDYNLVNDDNMPIFLSREE